jgi:hypothetical protein
MAPIEEADKDLCARAPIRRAVTDAYEQQPLPIDGHQIGALPHTLMAANVVPVWPDPERGQQRPPLEVGLPR